MTQKAIASIAALACALVCTAAEPQAGQTANTAAKPKHDVELVFISETTDEPEDVWMKNKLESKVLSRYEFRSGVANDYVLVYIDTPENKSRLSEHAKAANPKIVEKYDVEGFPTTIVLDGDGKELARESGYNGKANEYVKKLMDLRKGNPAEDKDY